MAHIKIDVEACKGCYLCAHVCPKKSIIISKKLNTKGYHPAAFAKGKECTGCATCLLVCPDMAIEVHYDD